MTIPVPVPVSQFPDATLPLSGNEQVPFIQNGITKKGPASALAALAGVVQPEGTFVAAAGVNINVDLSMARWLFVDTSAGDASIASFLGGVPGIIGLVTNLGPNFLALSGAGILGFPDTTLPVGTTGLLYYSGTVNKWVLV